MAMLARHMGRFWLLGILLASLGWAGSAGMAVALELGEKAPDFRLPSTTGQMISLSQFLGKKLVLLEFYVHEFGPT